MGIVEGVVSAVIFGILTTMGWLAYEHPESYARLYTPLVAIAGIFEVGAIAFNLGHQIGWQAALVSTKSVLSAGSQWQEPFPGGWLVLGIILFNGYAFVLCYLRKFLGLPEERPSPVKSGSTRRKKSG